LRTVVDASVAAKWYFEESGVGLADELLERDASGEGELWAPDLIVPELASVLVKKIRRGECAPPQADRVLELWQIDCPRLISCRELANRAVTLAIALDLSSYDGFYLAAAVEANATLATADRALARSARTVLADVIEIA